MQDPIYSKIENPSRPSLFAASAFMLLAAAGLWLSALLELALPRGASSLLLNAAYYLPFMLLPLALYARKHTGLAEAMRLNPLSPGAALLLTLLALLSVFAASALAAAWGYGLDALGLRSPGSVAVPASERELALSILGMAALPAVCEELMFRGFALSAWESRGTAFAIAVTSALFALLHGNLYGLPAYLLVGAVAAFATFALDSIYAGIIYHTVYNAACLVIPYLLAGQADAAESAVDAATLLSVALELVLQLGMMALLLAALWMRAKRADVEPIPRIRRPLSTREKAMLYAAVGAMLASTVVVAALAVAS